MPGSIGAKAVSLPFEPVGGIYMRPEAGQDRLQSDEDHRFQRSDNGAVHSLMRIREDVSTEEPLR